MLGNNAFQVLDPAVIATVSLRVFLHPSLQLKDVELPPRRWDCSPLQLVSALPLDVCASFHSSLKQLRNSQHPTFS